MSIDDGEQIGLSSRFFAYLSQSMVQINTILEKSYAVGYIAVKTGKNTISIVDKTPHFNFVLTKTKFEIGGITDVDCYWRGMDLHLSSSVLGLIKSGVDWTTGLSGLITAIDPSKFSGIVTAVSALGGIGIDQLYSSYPNGMVITMGGYLVPVYVTGQ